MTQFFSMTDAFYTTEAMAAAFAPEMHVRQMLAFEAALARAEAHAGIIPPDAAHAIASACRLEYFDVPALYRDAATAGTLAIPLVIALTAQVGDTGRAFVHWGATSQDVIDTAVVLQMRDGLDVLIADLYGVCLACADLVRQHRRTLMAGRTLLQQALPISFGLKAARWLGLAMRQISVLREQRQALVLQFGGAAGTLAALGDRGFQVAGLLAAELRLPLPDLPWHAERDRIAHISSALGITAGSMAKIAQDVVLLAQSEVGEVAEASVPGKGGSSALPQKHNPVDATLALAAARLAMGHTAVVVAAMVQEHERATGGWQAEWVAIPDLFRTTASTVARIRSTVTGLQVNADRMRANLDHSGALIMAESLTMMLANHLGRPEAQRLIADVIGRVYADHRTFREAAHTDPAIRACLTPDAIDRALDPRAYLGSADIFIDRVLANYSALNTGEPHGVPDAG